MRQQRQAGQALIISILFLVVVLVLVSTLMEFVGLNVRGTRSAVAKEQALQLAEAGIDKAVWELNQTAGAYTGENGTVLGTGVFDVSVSDISGSVKEITATGHVPSKTNQRATRQVRVKVNISTASASFSYGMQVGNGGVFMQNNSKIIGSVYSSGDIIGQNSPEITGDAFAAHTSQISGISNIGGHARAHEISNSTIGKNATSSTSIVSSTILRNAYADTISSSNIAGNAYYFTSISGSTVGGSLFPSTPPPADLPEIPFPISDMQIGQWEEDAESGGIYTGPCPYILTSGTTNLGPLKIDCDFEVANTAVVVVNGPIWVAGDFEVHNSAQIKLNPSYGNGSEVIVADNPSNRITSSKIEVHNSSQVLGSGSAGSYIMLISQNNSAELGGDEVAISPKNDADASIYYAAHGKVRIQNDTTLKEVTAYAIHIQNFAQLIYEIGLAGLQFSSGPGGSWQIERGTWREIK